MASRWFDIVGTVNWAKVHKPDTKFNEMGEYNLDFFPDDMDEFKKLGLERTPKEDEDGNFYVRLKRDHKKLIKGDLVEFGPPKVSLRKGPREWEDYTGNIGNGSKVILNICVFDTRKAPGHRIERISILDLVEYNPTPATETPSSYAKDLDDDIPF
jgi:hypothetical protein